MTIRMVRDTLTRADLTAIAADQFGDMVKVVVDSVINIRPAQGNRSRGVEDARLQARIRTVIAALVRG